MAVASMTGFARAAGEHGLYAWTWEVKSVNGRSLDVRCRLPAGHEALEPALRAAAAERFRRGHLNVALQVALTSGTQQVRVNEAVLAEVLTAVETLRQRIDAAPPRLDGLLGLRGVLEAVETAEMPDVREQRERAMLVSAVVALDALLTARRAEGTRIEALLLGQLDEVERLVAAAEDCAATQPDALRTRLREQVAALLEAVPALPEERLTQEAALLATKADVREELDRLRAHITAARETLAAPEAAGRRLDFLAQEFNREANTLCSKSADVRLTQLGLDLKVAIDRFREQAQNIE